MNCDFAGHVGLADTRVFTAGVHFMEEGEGFRQLPGTTGAEVHQPQYIHQRTIRVPRDATSVHVELTGVNRQRSGDYQAMVTPRFNSGSFWISDQDRDGFTVNFEKPAPADAAVAVMVSHEPMINSKRKVEYWEAPED
jgi:hypothetical protein